MTDHCRNALAPGIMNAIINIAKQSGEFLELLKIHILKSVVVLSKEQIKVIFPGGMEVIQPPE